MSEEKREEKELEQTAETENGGLSPTWAQDALADLEDWIEEQGIYIRQ